MQMKMPRLSAPSLAALTRFAAMLIVVAAWFLIVTAATRRYVSPVPILLVAAVIATAHAVRSRDTLLGPDLGRADEAAGLIAVAGLVRLIESSPAWSVP